MKSYKWFTILTAILILMILLTRSSSPVTGQQSQTSNESQASIAAKEKLRRLAATQKTYQVGYSPVMERKLTELSGIEIPRGTVRQALQVRQVAQRRLAEYKEYRERPENGFIESLDVYKSIRDDLQKTNPGKQIPNDVKGFIPLLPAFNWFEHNLSGGGLWMKNQGACNSCWAFAALAAYQYSYEIGRTRISTRYRAGNGVLITAYRPTYFSEQTLISCAGKGTGCGGGWHGTAFSYLIEYGAPLLEPGENPRDYKSKDTPCKERKENKDYKALTWDYVNYPPDKIPTEMQLKTALLEHGPLVVLVRIPEAFQAYQGGVFNEHQTGEINHAVTLVGWDDTKRAWLIQNSWGEDWSVKIKSKFPGDETRFGGFMWIAWDSNSVGKYAAWIEAAIDYRL